MTTRTYICPNCHGRAEKGPALEAHGTAPAWPGDKVDDYGHADDKTPLCTDPATGNRYAATPGTPRR